MDLKEFDKILLKTGETAYIVEVLKPGAAYIADIDRDGGTETGMIRYENIERKLD